MQKTRLRTSLKVPHIGRHITVAHINAAGGLFTSINGTWVPSTKCNLLIALAKTAKVDILAFSEAHIHPKAQLPNNWSFSSADSSSRGVAICALNEHISPLSCRKHLNRGCILTSYFELPGIQFSVTVVYAPHEKRDRESLFNELNSMELDHNNLFIGDFNVTVSPLDTFPTRKKISSQALINQFSDFLATHSLSDLCASNPHCGPSRSVPTRQSKDGSSGARLDKALLPKSSQLACVKHSVTPTPLSDHALIAFKFQLQNPFRGPGRYMVNSSAFSSKEGAYFLRKTAARCTEASKNLHDAQHIDNNARVWDYAKSLFIDELKAYSASRAKANLQEFYSTYHDIRSLQREIETLKINQTLSDLVPALIRRLHMLENKLHEHLVQKYEGSRIRCRAKWRFLSEKPNKFWLRREKSDAIAKSIREMYDPDTNQLTSDPQKIANCIATHLHQTYKHKHINNRDLDILVDNLLRSLDPKVMEELQNIETDISADTVINTINKCPSDTSPGPDGIPYSIYKTIKNEVSVPLAKAFSDIQSRARLPESMSSSIITCIPKKDKPTNIAANLRPISLSNTDYKIFTKILYAQIINIIKKLIPSHQTGFLPGRDIRTNVLHLQLLIDRLEQDDEHAAFLFLDWEKAFDRVSHQAIIHLFTALQLPNPFVRSLRAIYRHASAKVQLSGFFSQSIDIHSGTKQGDPLSPLIFVLIAELFNSFLSSKLPGVGGSAETDPFRTLAYADDTVVAIQNSSDLDAFQEAIRLYESATAAKLNYSKSTAIILGDIPDLHAKLHSLNFDVVDHGSPVTYLGCPILSNDASRFLLPEDSYETLETTLLDKVHKKAIAWSNLYPSLFGRATLVNSVLLSQIWYYASILPLSNSFFHKIRKLIINFMWGFKNFHSISQGNLFMDSSKGGLGLLDPLTQARSMLSKWAILALNPRFSAPWAAEFRMHIKRYDNKSLPLPLKANVPKSSAQPSVSPMVFNILSTWSRISARAPQLLPGDWVRSVNNNSFTNWIYRVTNIHSFPDRPSEATLEWFPNNSITSPSPNLWTEPTYALVKVTVNTDVDGNITVSKDIDPFQTLAFHSENGKIILVSDTNFFDKPKSLNRILYKSHQTYSAASPPPKDPIPEVAPRLGHIVSSIRNSCLPPNAKKLEYLNCFNATSTNSHLQKRGVIDSNACPLCGDDETRKHLFDECPVSSPTIRDFLRATPELHPQTTLSAPSSNLSTLDLEIHGILAFTVWKFRCDVIYNHLPPDNKLLSSKLFYAMTTHIDCLNELPLKLTPGDRDRLSAITESLHSQKQVALLSSQK
jgi:hypothetical protein